MYTILNSQGLGVSGRQNELIELALTHRFDGVEVDMADLVGRHDTMGKEFACQFFQSAKIDVGTFQLPIDLGADEETYEAQSAKVDTILDLANTLGAKRCYVPIQPIHPTDSFQDNLNRHEARLKDLGARFAEKSVQIGLTLNIAKASSEGTGFIQTAEELLSLIRSVGNPNVGLCLDAFQWQLASGAMDQIKDLDLATLTEVRLADVSENVDPANIKPEDMLLPGDVSGSFSMLLCKYLIDSGFEGPLSVGTNQKTFKGAPRHNVVSRFRKRLQQLIDGEDPNAPVEIEEVADESGDEAAAEQAAATDKPAAEEKADAAPVAAGADTK